jgi:chromosomal replication initiator protein
MWLLRKHTAMSLPEIGRFMNRDHSSVLHGIRRVETLVARNGEYRDDLNALADEQTFARALALEAA